MANAQINSRSRFTSPQRTVHPKESDRLHAIIVSDSDELSAAISESMAPLGLECRSMPISGLGPNAKGLAGFDGLVVFATHVLHNQNLSRLRQITTAVLENAKVVVVSQIRDHGTVLNGIRAGASDFLGTGDCLDEELAGLIERIRQCSNQKSAGRVVSIVPCQAPNDASVVAVNMAAIISRRTGGCGLLDFHFRGAELAYQLKLSPRHTICDLLSNQVNIDKVTFEQALTSHESGIQLLAGPELFTDLRNVRPQLCQQIIALARQAHEVVIINTEDVQHAEQVRALAVSDEIFVTMRLDLISLHRAKQHIEFLTRNNVLPEQIHVVALETGLPSEIPPLAAKKVLQVAKLHCLPSDSDLVLRAANIGNPLVFESPKSKLSQAFNPLVDVVIGQDTPSPSTINTSRIAAMKSAASIALSLLPIGK